MDYEKIYEKQIIALKAGGVAKSHGQKTEMKKYYDEAEKYGKILKEPMRKLRKWFYTTQEDKYNPEDFKKYLSRIGEYYFKESDIPKPSGAKAEKPTEPSKPLTKAQKTKLIKSIPHDTYNADEIIKIVDDIREGRITNVSDFPKPSGKGELQKIEITTKKKLKQPEPESESEEEEEVEEEVEEEKPKKKGRVLKSRVKFEYTKAGNLKPTSKASLLKYISDLTGFDKKVKTLLNTKVRKNEILNDDDLNDAVKQIKIKEVKQKKEKPLKLWFGIEEPPKGHRRASMQEAKDAGKINYYGLKAVDKKTLFGKTKEKVNLPALHAELAGLRGKMSKIKRQRDQARDEDKEQVMKDTQKEYDEQIYPRMMELAELIKKHTFKKEK